MRKKMELTKSRKQHQKEKDSEAETSRTTMDKT